MSVVRWTAAQAIATSLGVVLSIVVSILSYRMHDPGRLTRIETAIYNQQRVTAELRARVAMLEGQLDARPSTPPRHPGRLGQAPNQGR